MESKLHLASFLFVSTTPLCLTSLTKWSSHDSLSTAIFSRSWSLRKAKSLSFSSNSQILTRHSKYWMTYYRPSLTLMELSCSRTYAKWIFTIPTFPKSTSSIKQHKESTLNPTWHHKLTPIVIQCQDIPVTYSRDTQWIHMVFLSRNLAAYFQPYPEVP